MKPYHLATLLVFSTMILPCAASKDTLLLSSPLPDTLDLRPYLAVYYDSAGSTRLADVEQYEFNPYTNDTFRLTDTHQLWVRFTLSVPKLTEARLYVQNFRTKSNRSTVYLPSVADWTAYQGGGFVTPSRSADSLTTPGHILKLLPDSGVYTYYIKYERIKMVPISTVFVPRHFTFVRQDIFQANRSAKLLDHLWYYNLYHAFWGISGLFLLLNLARAFYERRTTALWSASFVFFAALLMYFYYEADAYVAVLDQAQHNRLAYFYASLQHHVILILQVNFILLYLFQLLFYQHFFGLAATHPRTNRVFNLFKYLYLVFIVLIVLTFYLQWKAAFDLTSSLAQLTGLLASIILVVAIFRIRSTLAYLIAAGSVIAIIVAGVGTFDGVFYRIGFMWRAVLSMLSFVILYLFYYLGLSYRARLIEVAASETRAAKALSDQRNRLLTNITHEFRTPLTIIQGVAGRITGASNQARRNSIQRASQRLKLLVDQILDLQKIEAGELGTHWGQGDLGAFLAQEIAHYQPLAASQGITLEILLPDEPLRVDFDPQKMQQILANLLSNALKYMTTFGKVQLQLQTPSQEPEAAYKIKVTDNGPGIPPEALPYIFDRFYQADPSLTRSGEGTGIGLAHTQELVQLLDGHIQVESKLGEGTIFVLTFPIRRQAPPFVADTYFTTSSPAPTVSPILPPLHLSQLDQAQILVVEDNPDLLHYLSSCLRHSYRLLTARNGQEGLALAQKHLPDLIISDVMMPRMDGFTMLQCLRRDERTNHLPVVLLTAKSTQVDKLEGLRVGADAYLTKPFDEPELYLRIEQLIAYRHTLQRKYAQSILNGEAPTEVFLQRLHRLLLERLSDPELRIRDIARTLHMDRSQLFRKVKQLTDQDPSSYLRQLRLQRAHQLLRQTQRQVSDIAYSCGFASPASFSKAYKGHYGHSPSAERKQS